MVRAASAISASSSAVTWPCSRSSRLRRSSQPRSVVSSWVRFAVRSASAAVNSPNRASLAARVAPAAPTRASTLVRRSAPAAASCASASCSLCRRASAASASAQSRCSRSESFSQLDEPPRQLGDALPCERSLALQGVAGDHEALQHGGGPGLAFAQCRQVGRRIGPAGRGFGFGAGAFRHLAHPGGMGGFRLDHLGLRLHQAQVEQRRLRFADVLRQRAVTHGLAGLALQGVDLAGELADHVLQPRQVLLCCAQPQLGLMAPGMKSGNACSLFEHPAALLGLGLDDLADTPLVHQRRRARAGGGVGEQDLDVAGAHLAAVEPIGRALLAFDAARHFEQVVAVELGGGGAR